MDFQKLDNLFHPSSVAIIGASENELSAGYAYTRFLKEEFQGNIYPVNPKLDEILGLKAFSNLEEAPDPVDYVISCISAEKIPDLIEECGNKNVQIIHLFTARMSETGRVERKQLEKEVLRKAEKYDIRVLGPNCMGVYNPEVGLSYNYDFPQEPGCIGVISQSGGASSDLVHYGGIRGLRFSKVFSYGNALDLDESELLQYLAKDDQTEVIAIYIEGVNDGKNFVDSLKFASERKPIVVLKGGKSKAGERSVSSHTASMAGSEKVWKGIFSQCGAVEVQSFKQWIDQLVAFRFVPQKLGKRLLIAGGGGGKSALSADIWEKEGFKIPEIPQTMRDELKDKAPEVWDWLKNPVDFSILQDSFLTPDEVLKMFETSEEVDFFIFNLTTGDFLPKDAWRLWMEEQKKGMLKLKKDDKPAIVVAETSGAPSKSSKSWRWESIGELCSDFIEKGVPVFSSPKDAARALRNAIDYWKSQ